MNPALQLRYDEDLVEAAVFLCANGRRPGVPPAQIARFQREREKLYGILDPDERNTAFFKLHLEWFREWDLEKPLLDLLAGFKLLAGALGVVAFRKARGKNEEGAELFVKEAGPRTAVVALRSERFARAAALIHYLRHEFTHLQDMVDPAFGYSPELYLPGWNSAQQRLVRERYRLLWDITIDGRLVNAGHPPMAARAQHAAAFAGAYNFWPPDQQARVFDSLWQGATPTHAEVLDLASNPRGLRVDQKPSPGASCPLCGFSTFVWRDTTSLAPAIKAAVTGEFPDWTVEQGLCDRCHQSYQVAVANRADAEAAALG